ncbi:uncharacterized protein DS421_11g331830 [Arachis hypogaea]|nr:uncharacterized protein DS421_11g331830 [Arachis hypogaea]
MSRNLTFRLLSTGVMAASLRIPAIQVLVVFFATIMFRCLSMEQVLLICEKLIRLRPFNVVNPCESALVHKIFELKNCRSVSIRFAIIHRDTNKVANSLAKKGALGTCHLKSEKSMDTYEWLLVVTQE